MLKNFYAIATLDLFKQIKMLLLTDQCELGLYKSMKRRKNPN
jgi:hypothetical protein